MKTCKGCKYAEWARTASGRLHPSGQGKCKFPMKIPVLPQAYRWGFMADKPSINGGWINRKDELRDHCAYYAREDSTGNVVLKTEGASQ